MRLFGQVSLQKLTFVWLIFTLQAGIYLVAVFNPFSDVIFWLLVLTGILGLLSSVQLISKSFHLKKAKMIFMQITDALVAMLITGFNR